jgi:hypothetical protein
VALTYVDIELARLRAEIARVTRTPASAGLQPGDPIPWTDLSGVPATFAPSAHVHDIADVTGLQAELDGKQPAGSYATAAQGALADTALQPGDTIPWTDVSGKPTFFSGAYGDLTGIPSTFTPAAHNQAWSTITSTPTTLAGYGITDAATSAQGALAATASQPGHTHAQSDVTGLVTALAGKAATTHSHVIADTTGLQTALDGKQALNATLTAISGGTMDGVAIGGTTPAAGTFTTLTSGNAAINAGGAEARLTITNTSTGGADPDAVLYLNSGNSSGEALVELQQGGVSIGRVATIGTDIRIAADTGKVSVSTGGSIRQTIDESGLVGFGTATPLARVHVSGDTFKQGNVYTQQAAPASKSGAATLTIAELLAGLVQYTGGTAQNLTLPTGTNIDAGVIASLPNNGAFDFCVINTGSATATLTTAAGLTLVGSMAVTAGTSGRFRARKTAANTFTIYRV